MYTYTLVIPLVLLVGFIFFFYYERTENFEGDDNYNKNDLPQIKGSPKEMKEAIEIWEKYYLHKLDKINDTMEIITKHLGKFKIPKLP